MGVQYMFQIQHRYGISLPCGAHDLETKYPPHLVVACTNYTGIILLELLLLND